MRLARAAARVGRSDAERAEMRGVTGTMNLEFTGAAPGGWRMVFRDGALEIAPGLAPDARATVRMSSRDFLALVAGDQTMTVARMTGKVRVAGDGSFGIIFGAFVGTLQNAQRLPGVRGWLARRLIGRALSKGGYHNHPQERST